ncbi:MAG: pyruvate kinase [Candidatus Omnitrophota bacterium]
MTRVRTKIIATLGPASSTPTVVRGMMRAGLDVVRLNFSHGTPEEHEDRIGLVRRCNSVLRRHIRFLGDLEGHRIRVGSLKNHRPLALKKGQVFWLRQGTIVGAGDTVGFDYEDSLAAIRPGHYIYIDDGTIALKVVTVSRRCLETRVVVGGLLKEHKGLNIPEARLHFPALSVKDKADIGVAARYELDFLAQSFVRTARDILEVRKELRQHRARCKVVAKIENREGIRNIEEIIETSDGIMIARGDMGVSIPLEEVPVVQKEIIRRCNKKKKFVITATQMLESMTENRLPTRAEATDVANAVLDGTDYTMLSAETAVGEYPVEAVAMMNKIIRFIEQWQKHSF